MDLREGIWDSVKVFLQKSACTAYREIFLPQNFHGIKYKSHKTYLTNHMGSISHHITPLVINSLRGRHTHTTTHTDIRGQSNFKKPGVHQPMAGTHLL